MSFEKVVDTKIFGITFNATGRVTLGEHLGTTASATTAVPNPMRGTLLWDKATYVIQGVTVAGGATGGSYTITLQTDAVAGYTGLPIAQVVLGPNSASGIVMDSLHQSAASPLPTHVNIAQGSTGLLNMDIHVVAKQYRGMFSGGVNTTAERVLQGNLIQGTSAKSIFADDKGFEQSETFTFGTSGINNLGMHRLRLWDNALFWVVSNGAVDGAHDVDIVSTVGGTTVSIASTGTGGALNVAGEKVALANAFYGQCPTPTAIIWTEETGTDGVSDPRVVVLAKSGRGSQAKR